jgi:hypothetical protein
MLKSPEKHSPIKVAVIMLSAIIFSFLMVLILPYLFIVFLHHWERHERDVLSRAAHSPTDAVLCDGGETEHPFFEEWQRLEEMRRMQVDSTPLVDAIRRDAFVSEIEQMLEKRKGRV